MKSKLKFFVPVGLVVLALVCVIVVRQGDASPDDLLGAQQSNPAEEVLNTAPSDPVDEVVYTLPPIPSSVPVFTAKPDSSQDGSPAGGTTTVEEDGTIVIIPDFEAQASQAVKVVTPDSQVTANIGSGGGDLELGSDGVFHGTPPTPSPAPAAAPVTTTPAPVVSSTPETSPAPAPSQGGQEPQGGPPSYNGTYDGQMSSDGRYMWIGGLGWIDQNSSNGGMGGQFGTEGEVLSGHKVGNM